jgi:hypothetical protein
MSRQLEKPDMWIRKGGFDASIKEDRLMLFDAVKSTRPPKLDAAAGLGSLWGGAPQRRRSQGCTKKKKDGCCGCCCRLTRRVCSWRGPAREPLLRRRGRLHGAAVEHVEHVRVGGAASVAAVADEIVDAHARAGRRLR